MERGLTVGTAPWCLDGLLTLPEGAHQVPGVVLLHGSGVHDRDHRVGPHQTFRALAHGLARRGVAALRFDKRNHTYGARLASRLAPQITLHEEAVADGIAAYIALGEQSEVNPSCRFVLGYSLGGLAAVRLAATVSVRGVVLIASSPRPLPEILLDQARRLASLPDEEGAAFRAALPGIESDYRRLQALERGVRSRLNEQLLGKPLSYWSDLAAHSLGDGLRQHARPVLVVHPGRDYQVGERDLAAWHDLLTHHPLAELRCYPELNHLLVAGSEPSTPADWRHPGAMADEVLDHIAHWVRQNATAAQEAGPASSSP